MFSEEKEEEYDEDRRATDGGGHVSGSATAMGEAVSASTQRDTAQAFAINNK